MYWRLYIYDLLVPDSVQELFSAPDWQREDNLSIKIGLVHMWQLVVIIAFPDDTQLHEILECEEGVI